ncbi:hypothetical protein [Virgibacillus sp. YIM 98842]|nr:hypothetical protein [Virgibacillus sp. YIM 98842]
MKKSILSLMVLTFLLSPVELAGDPDEPGPMKIHEASLQEPMEVVTEA